MRLSEVIQKVIDFTISHGIPQLLIHPVTENRVHLYVEYVEYNPQAKPREEAETFFKEMGVVGLCMIRPIFTIPEGSSETILTVGLPFHCDVELQFHYTVSDTAPEEKK